MAIREAETNRLAVLSPYGNLRGIYVLRSTHEGKPAYVRLVKGGMDSTATTCIFFTSTFSSEARWYFGKSLPDDKPCGCSMESFCSAPGDATFPEAAHWPHEDIFKVREATDEDEENMYFFPHASRRQPGGFNPGDGSCGYVGASIGNQLLVLGLSKADFTMRSVRAAYRRLVLQLHPDKGGDKERFQAMQNAYEAVIQALTGESRQSEAEPGVPEAQSSQSTPTGNATVQVPKLSEVERDSRRQRAMEAALRRQGQAP
jgi:hypothetical protein